MIVEKPLFWRWCKQETGNINFLAQELGVSKTFVSFLANEKKAIPIDKLAKISEITGIKVKDLRPDIYEIFKGDL